MISGANEEELELANARADILLLQQENAELKKQQQEFIKYLEEEKDRLARGTSHTYKDSLEKTRFVNEDIFNEVDKNLQKYKKVIGNDK